MQAADVKPFQEGMRRGGTCCHGTRVAGSETSFSSFGRSVVAHADGFQVESFIPGGKRLRASGTSMAAPQEADPAAKL